MEYKHLKFEVKSLNDIGEFEGYAAVKGNTDSYGDIIQNGAFKRTIRNKKNFPILWMHDPSKPVGISTLMKEDEKGLYTRGQLDLSTETGKMVYSGLKMGYIDSMSIGYRVIQDDIDKRGNRLLKEIKLLEYSLVTKGFAANDLALVSGFKSIHDKGESTLDHKDILQRLDELEEKMKLIEEKSLADSPKGTQPFLMPEDSGNPTLQNDEEQKFDESLLSFLKDFNNSMRGE